MAMTQRSMTITPQKADDDTSRVLTMPLSKNWRLLLECAFGRAGDGSRRGLTFFRRKNWRGSEELLDSGLKRNLTRSDDKKAMVWVELIVARVVQTSIWEEVLTIAQELLEDGHIEGQMRVASASWVRLPREADDGPNVDEDYPKVKRVMFW